jgi:hypothetical protein
MQKPKIRNTLKKPRSPNYSRTKGHVYEQQLAIEFREKMGEPRCRTSRQASRLLDDCKVDLTSNFANVQAKNVVRNINYNQLINEIRVSLELDFPERLSLAVAVFHK